MESRHTSNRGAMAAAVEYPLNGLHDDPFHSIVQGLPDDLLRGLLLKHAARTSNRK